MTRSNRPLFLAALVAGSSYYANDWLDLHGGPVAAWKGMGVGLLALWAATRARVTDGWLIAAALALGALGDVLLNTHGLVTGAYAFIGGHSAAAFLFLRNRVSPAWHAFAVALLVAGVSWTLPADRGFAPLIALYAFFLGAMAGTAWTSRFPWPVKLGAALFVVSDLVIFARHGPLAQVPLAEFAVWPTYFGAQALIAWGVVTALAEDRHEDLHDRL